MTERQRCFDFSPKKGGEVDALMERFCEILGEVVEERERIGREVCAVEGHQIERYTGSTNPYSMFASDIVWKERCRRCTWVSDTGTLYMSEDEVASRYDTERRRRRRSV